LVITNKMIAKLQYISQEPHLENIQLACEAGCDWIQIRAKNLNFDKYVQLAKRAKTIADNFNAKLIVNDAIHVAIEVGAYGVHLGKKDLDLSEARKLVDNKMIIGGSTNSLEDILEAADKGVDYLGLGPFRHTTTKTDLNPVLGLEGMAKIMNEVQKRNIKIPIIAIGGILLEDIRSLKEIGISGIAVSGLITLAKDKKKIVDDILSSFEQ
jgi:thiamine-phosphate pyrophosphorylase